MTNTSQGQAKDRDEQVLARLLVAVHEQVDVNAEVAPEMWADMVRRKKLSDESIQSQVGISGPV